MTTRIRRKCPRCKVRRSVNRWSGPNAKSCRPCMHAYYLAHKEHIKEMVRKWRAANPEWCRRWSREYAARRRKQRLA